MKWIRIALSIDDILLGPNNIAEIQAGTKIICVAKGINGWYAFSQKCPHAGGFMSEGYLDSSDNVVCPLHRYKFNLTNGRNVMGGYYLKTFKIEVRLDGVFVSI